MLAATTDAKQAPAATKVDQYIATMAPTFKNLDANQLATREYNLQTMWEDKRTKTGATMLVLGTLAGLATAYAFTR